MSDKNDTLPLGKLLQNAGLISDEQLEIALGVQSQHTKMKLGEILALQEAVEVQTVNFFVNKWQEIKKQGQQFPLGNYLKEAYLLSDEQILIILAEQQNTKLKFGDLVVQKGWLNQETIDFFLNSLTRKSPSMMSLIDLEEYDRQFSHLEKKYTNSSLILSRVLAWTGGDHNLTKAICNVFGDSDWNIPAGKEINAVDRLIESSIIKNWRTSKIGTYIRSIRERLVDNQRCEPISLLAEYQDILLSNNRQYALLKEQEELLNLGIIVKNKDQLRVTNLIFQQVFDQNWIAKTRKTLEAKIKQKSAEHPELSEKNAMFDIQNSSIVQTDVNQNSAEVLKIDKTRVGLTKITPEFSSLFALAAIILLIPLALALNNYYSSLSEMRLSLKDISQASKLKQFCSEISLVDPSSALESISQIETNKELILRSFPNTLEGFPDNCETKLNKLRVLAAPQLGKENRVIEAIRNICKIPADAENINEAKIWIEHWYTSPNWGQETRSYLNLINDCPASK